MPSIKKVKNSGVCLVTWHRLPLRRWEEAAGQWRERYWREVAGSGGGGKRKREEGEEESGEEEGRGIKLRTGFDMLLIKH